MLKSKWRAYFAILEKIRVCLYESRDGILLVLEALNENLILIIFCFLLVIEDAVAGALDICCTSQDDGGFVVSEGDGVEMVDKCIGADVKQIDKCVGNNVVVKSVRTQYDATFVMLGNFKTAKEVLPVKISRPNKTHSNFTNTEQTFPPNVVVKFFIEEEVQYSPSDADSADEDMFDATYSPEEDLDEDDTTEDSCDNECEEDCDADKMFFASSSPATDPKCLVFWSCLLQLFKYCFKCLSGTKITKVRTRGSLLSVTMRCENNHQRTSKSQPILNDYGAGNLLLAASILYSGNTYMRIMEMLKMINIHSFSKTAYYNIQKTILYPVLNRVYKVQRNILLNQCSLRQENNLIGDGRCDSPGFSAKYATYTLMSSDVNRILDFHIIHVGTVENSGRMEKAGLIALLEKLLNHNVSISSFTTDRHVLIRAFLRKDHPEINHQFDVWHFGKSIKKHLWQAAKHKDSAEIVPWIKAIVNHLWWSCATFDGDAQLLKEKWLSILFHNPGIHSWDSFEIFSQCQHPPLEKQRKWLQPGTVAFLAVESIVKNKRELCDLSYLVNVCHTGNLEVFHSLLNNYCPKRLHFSPHGMIARTQLAVLDYNCGADCSQATTAD